MSARKVFRNYVRTWLGAVRGSKNEDKYMFVRFTMCNYTVAWPPKRAAIYSMKHTFNQSNIRYILATHPNMFLLLQCSSYAATNNSKHIQFEPQYFFFQFFLTTFVW